MKYRGKLEKQILFQKIILLEFPSWKAVTEKDCLNK